MSYIEKEPMFYKNKEYYIGDNIRRQHQYGPVTFYHHGFVCGYEGYDENENYNHRIQVIHFQTVSNETGNVSGVNIQRIFIEDFDKGKEIGEIENVGFPTENGRLQAVRRALEFHQKYQEFRKSKYFLWYDSIYTGNLSLGEIEKIIKELRQKVSEYKDIIIPYHFFRWNCEHLVTYFQTGKYESKQVKKKGINPGISEKTNLARNVFRAVGFLAVSAAIIAEAPIALTAGLAIATIGGSVTLREAASIDPKKKDAIEILDAKIAELIRKRKDFTDDDVDFTLLDNDVDDDDFDD
ncbi:MAG: hypothetical protein HEQ24_25150 [Dolichospermum sp. BR01]|nr:hypothetical protein [Dolichospermum sp. BR01]